MRTKKEKEEQEKGTYIKKGRVIINKERYLM